MQYILRDIEPLICWEHFSCFDNYSNYISIGDVNFIKNITNYLYRLNELDTYGTMHYVDVLAFKEISVDIVEEAIKQCYCVGGL